MFQKELYGYITLSSTNVFLHTFCVILLIQINRTTNQNVQHLFLINLSVAELIKNLLSLIRLLLVILLQKIGFQPNNHSVKFIMEAINYMSFEISVIAYTSYFNAMMLLTADRLAAMVLNIRYKVLCTKQRAKIICLSTSIFSLLVILPIWTWATNK